MRRLHDTLSARRGYRGDDWHNDFEYIERGTSRVLTHGHDIALLSLGPIGNEAADAIDELAEEGISVEHIDLRFAKPLDEAMLRRVWNEFDKIVTAENGVVAGGVGSAVLEFFSSLPGKRLPQSSATGPARPIHRAR